MWIFANLKAFAAIGTFLISTTACSSAVSNSKQPYDLVDRSDLEDKVIINLTVRGQIIDRSFYGSHVDSFSSLPSAELIKDLGIGQLRVGGNEYDVYNWKTNFSLTKNGLFQLQGIPQIISKLRDYNVGGIFQINILGYQPELDGQTQVLRNTFTSNSAYEMIKSLNKGPKPSITNISLGNEFEQWHETHPHTKAWGPDSGISADEYVDKYIEFALAVRKAQEEVSGNPNSIKIWGPEISSSWLDWNTGNFTKDCKWSDVPGQVECSYGNGKFTHFIPYFLDRLAKAESNRTLNPKKYKLLDYFAFHYYPNFRKRVSDINSIVTDPDGRQWVSKMLEATRILHDPTYTNTIDVSSFKNQSPNIIGRMKEWLKNYYPNARLAINEFAVDSDYRSTGYHPIVRPLYIADAVGISQKQGVSFFNNFVLSSPAGSNIPWSLLDGGETKTNAFHSFAIIANHLFGTVVNADDNLGDVINSYATDSDKFVNLMLINKSPLDRTVQIYLKNKSTKKVATYLVPGWSINVLEIEKNAIGNGNSFNVYKYGADEMGIPKDPNYSKY